ncbi:ECF transporter S component [Moorella naiadis]|uniref:ECF transporter S component n=1 Tax=Moorella naiadis (nom. illeg.) TaxID=3093670 RepID=UPI003D9CACD5
MAKPQFKTATSSGRQFGNTHPAVIAVWAAVLSVAHMLPSLPMIGTGGTFSVSTALFPLSGIFFGPIPGAICAAIGSFIGQILAPHTAWLGLGTFIVGTINALVAGCVSRGKPLPAVGIILLGTLLWFTTAIGRQVPMFPAVFYSLGVLGALIGGFLGFKWLARDNVFGKAVGVWLAAFTGFVGAASIANYFTLIVLKLPAKVWIYLTFVAPVERTIFAIGSAIIGIPLLIGLPKIGVFVGPQAEKFDEEDED